MASTYSSNLRLELIGSGEQQGSWGATTNTNLGTLLEDAIAGYVAVPVTDGADTTLTVANGAADQSRNMTINLTGTLTAARNVICPAIEKVYIVKNSTTGGFAVTFKVSGQTGVSIPNGATYILFVDGTDVRQATGSIVNGGTGATTAAGARTNLGVGTSDTPQFAGIEVGNASDTTLTRSAAGVLAVEGGVIPKENRANTFTAAQTISSLTGTSNSFNFSATGWNSIVRVGRNSTLGSDMMITNNWESYGNTLDDAALGTSFIKVISGFGGGVLSFGSGAVGALPAERMRINADGTIGIGTTGAANSTLYLNKNLTGATSAYGVSSSGTIQSDVTALGVGYATYLGTAAASFTTNIDHFRATQNVFGAGSTVAAQVSFNSAGLIGANYNYAFLAGDTSGVTSGKQAIGFYSGINTATGGGTTWAFYGAGTANSFLSGSLGIGSTSLTGITLRLSKPLTGSAYTHAVLIDTTIQSDSTSVTAGVSTSIGTAAASFSTVLNHFQAVQSTIGAGSTITYQTSYASAGNNIGGTYNFAFSAADTSAVTTGKIAYGFYSALNIATGGGTTWGFYANGTAYNTFMGNTGIGSVGAAGAKLVITNDRAVNGYALKVSNYNGATFEADIILGHNGSVSYFGNFQQTPLTFLTSNSERARLDTFGNFLVGTTSAGTSAAKVVAIGNGTAPSTSPAGVGQLYVESGALKYRGASGTVTTIAPA